MVDTRQKENVATIYVSIKGRIYALLMDAEKSKLLSAQVVAARTGQEKGDITSEMAKKLLAKLKMD